MKEIEQCIVRRHVYTLVSMVHTKIFTQMNNLEDISLFFSFSFKLFSLDPSSLSRYLLFFFLKDKKLQKWMNSSQSGKFVPIFIKILKVRIRI